MMGYQKALFDASSHETYRHIIRSMCFNVNKDSMKPLIASALSYYVKDRPIVIPDELLTKGAVVDLVSIVGGIGSGKTTYINNHREPGTIIIEEPHYEWRCDKPKYGYAILNDYTAGETIDLLQAHLHDVSRTSFNVYLLFQLSTIMSRVRIMVLLYLSSILNIPINANATWEYNRHDIAERCVTALLSPIPDSPTYIRVLIERNIFIDTFVFARNELITSRVAKEYGIYHSLVAAVIDFTAFFFSRGIKLSMHTIKVPFSVQLFQIVHRNRSGELTKYFGDAAVEAKLRHDANDIAWFEMFSSHESFTTNGNIERLRSITMYEQGINELLIKLDIL